MNSIELRYEGPAAWITLNRPEKRNAITLEMIDEIAAALEMCERRRRAGEVRVLVLTGAGTVFCSGMDLAMLKDIAEQTTASSPPAGTAAEPAADARRMAELFAALYRFPAPTIAMVQGHAIAGGCGLASVCDFSLAVPEAKFGYTEVRIGFMPALVTVYLLRLVGEKRARDLLLTGRIFGAHEALAWGLVTEVVPADQLLQRTRELIAELLHNSPGSLVETKRLIERLASQPDFERALEAAAIANTAIRQTADFREGITAFLEKRPPDWRHGRS